MAMNFEEQEGRQDYLNNKLDDLLEGINSSYGQSLLNELVRRLNRTIEDFNSERRHQIIHDLMEGKELESQKAASSSSDNAQASPSHEDSGSDSEEMSAWEKRLEGLE